MHVFEKSGTTQGQLRFGSAAADVDDELLAAEGRLRARNGLASAARGLGALSLLAVGAVHLQQFFELYSAIPTIGTLFVLNFAAATVIGLALLTPVECLFGRWGGRVLAASSLGGIGLAATAFVFLLISERMPLFGFMEPGYDPAAILAARVAEAATVLFLTAFLAAGFLRRAPDRASR